MEWARRKEGPEDCQGYQEDGGYLKDGGGQKERRIKRIAYRVPTEKRDAGWRCWRKDGIRGFQGDQEIVGTRRMEGGQEERGIKRFQGAQEKIRTRRMEGTSKMEWARRKEGPRGLPRGPMRDQQDGGDQKERGTKRIARGPVGWRGPAG